MAKQRRKAELTRSQDRQGQVYEETFDDSLLPDAAEIQKLHAIDPEILEWLKKRAEKEQEFRHETFQKRVDIVRRSEGGERWINYLGLIFAFH